MEDTQSEFAALMERVQAGCPDAAHLVFHRYGDAVRRVVRRWLGQPLRRHYDSADVEQSVWASFFQIPAERLSFQQPEELVAFLGKVAYNKVVDRTRHGMRARRRGALAERSLDEPHGPDAGVTLAGTLPAAVHSPSKYVMADERWQKMTRNLPPGHVRILEMILEGHSDSDIARQLGCDRKVIQRLLNRLKDLVQQG